MAKTRRAFDDLAKSGTLDYVTMAIARQNASVEDGEKDFEPPEPDDRARCSKCGRLISDAEFEDNRGMCYDCPED